MEDRYLFKAKRTDNGEWINGDLITTPFVRSETQENIPYILDITKADYDCFEDLSEGNGIFEVDSSTICQCTGLRDKNGKLIWENDITLRTSVTGTHKGKIIYSSDGSFCQKDFETTFENLLIHSESYFEIIGNIFDNPELLESEVN